MNKKIETEQEKMSYALGINIAQSIVQIPVKLDRNAVLEAIRDCLAENPHKINRDEYAKGIARFQKENQQAQTEAEVEIKEKNAREQNAFIAENEKKDNVVTTDSGLQYTVIKEGDGAKPSKNDTVRVHYTGTLLDGTEFDSSVKRGEPAEFGVGQVIRGWTEALQLMTKGSKYKLFIPSALAYGDRGAGNIIGPGAMLVFDVELLDII